MGACITLLTIISLVSLFLVKLWLKYVVAWDKSHTCLVGKTAIVTGANSGIGYHTALDFAKRGARVILACRNEAKAEEARKKITEASGNQNVVVELVDFASLTSVRNFAKQINATEKSLDILVNNAGILNYGQKVTEDGLELVMETNYFSHFLLTNLLIGLLKKSAPSRIVNVSSVSSTIVGIDVNNLNKFSNGPVSYASSKLCIILFSKELARRAKGSRVTSNSLHPGQTRTEIFRNTPRFFHAAWNVLVNAFFRTVEEGAQTPIYLSVSKDVEGISGEHFDNGRIAWLPPVNKLARDDGLAKKLWEKSEELVKLTALEKRL